MKFYIVLIVSIVILCSYIYSDVEAECLHDKAERLAQEITAIHEVTPIPYYVSWMAQYEYVKVDGGYLRDYLARQEEKINQLKQEQKETDL